MLKDKLTIEQLQNMRESEDHIEFKAAQQGNFAFNGGVKPLPKDRRKCILGYIVALCNEGGGYLVLGMHDSHPHKVVGTKQNLHRIGELENAIYKELGIRPFIYELFENDDPSKRVLVIDVPNRPKGKFYTFEEVPLMRVGEDLLPMDFETQVRIRQETEPDFSEMICRGVTISDLDKNAISILKQKYSEKQKNKAFASLPDFQALSDIGLIRDGQLTNAAVLLVGKSEVIATKFPQAKVMLEYRRDESQTRFERRHIFDQPFYTLINDLWNQINLTNGSVPVQDGPYMIDIPFFNEEVIRELINNAFAHRDYSLASEIVIKQFPTKMEVLSPGGFPKGVTLDNMLRVPSTPRNRLLADVLAKTGIVERSGQGLDVIFRLTLSEGKTYPDYTQTDDFFVCAIISGVVKDPLFALFLRSIQEELPGDSRLTVFDVLTLCKIKDGEQPTNRMSANRLVTLGCLEKHGKTNAIKYTLPRRYYELTGDLSQYATLIDWDANQVWAILCPYLLKYGKAKKTDFSKLIGNHLSDKQLRTMVNNFKKDGRLESAGERNNTVYFLSEKYKQEQSAYIRTVLSDSHE